MAKPMAERDTALLELYRQGHSLEAIGQELGISRQRVYQIVRSYQPLPPKRKLTSERLKEGTPGWHLREAAYRAEKTAVQIARAVGVDETTVRRWWRWGTSEDGRELGGRKLLDYAQFCGMTAEEALTGAAPPDPGHILSQKEETLLSYYRMATPQRRQEIVCFAMEGVD